MNIQTVCKALENTGVSYAVVGGYAVALHGAVRGTVDIDLVIRLELDSFIKVEQAMHNLGLVSRLPVSAVDVFKYRKEYIENRNLIAWSFYNPNSPADLIDIVITHDLTKSKTIKKIYAGQTIHVLSLEDLIQMKKKSNRPQDQADVISLEMLK